MLLKVNLLILFCVYSVIIINLNSNIMSYSTNHTLEEHLTDSIRRAK